MNKVFTFLFFVSYFSFGQNLIKNSNFEEFYYRPKNIDHNQLTEIRSWSSPSLGSSDFFYNEKINPFGIQNPVNGRCYVGLFVYAQNNSNYREYVQSELKSKLIEGEEYELTFYINLAESSTCSINTFGVQFSEKKIIKDDFFVLTPDTLNYHEVKRKLPFNKMEIWEECKILFTATGSEQFIIFGNFYRDNEKKKSIKYFREDRKCKTQTPGSYYYLDNLSLINVSKSITDKGVKATTLLLFEKFESTLIVRDLYYMSMLDSFPLEFYSLLNNIPFDLENVTIEFQFKTTNAFRYEKKQAKKKLKLIFKYLKKNKRINGRKKSIKIINDNTQEFENNKLTISWD